MSAQAGMWNFDRRPIDQVVLEKLSVAIEQYGPDGGDVFVDGSIAMVYRAFHTTLESRAERQPYRSMCGNVFTWDGRLDNREELILQLNNHLAGDHTDVRIVAAAFEVWGTDCFRRLVGDWAVSISRSHERELILAVDYMAVRHIFYYAKEDRIWWSTDLASLVLVSGDKFHIHDAYIAGYFGCDPDASLTPYSEIREVPPGQFVRVREGRVCVERHWRFSPKTRIRYKTDPEYEEHFRHVFRQSVRRRLRSDSPILAELSGGLDSSSIVCMADDILANEGAQTPSLDTISLYDKTEPDGDDWIYLEKIESKRGRPGAHIDASKVGSSPASLVYSAFSPLPGYLGTGRNLEAERADIVRAGGYRAGLSGIGGDEFMGGIPSPTAQLGDLIVQFKLARLAQHLMAWSLVKRQPWVRLLWQAVVGVLPVSLRQLLFRQSKAEPWIEKNFAKRVIRQLDVNGHFGFWLPTRRSHLAGVFLMANKIAKFIPLVLALEEPRFPYLDQNLIEFILSIPASQLLRPGERRSLMRRSLAGIVPLEILSRRTKQFGARTPIVVVEQNWEELRRAFDLPLSSRMGYINRECFMKKLCEARGGKEIHIVRMLRTISFEFWLRELSGRGLLENTAAPSLPGTEQSKRGGVPESLRVDA
jgi:asparagine synthase (glutamine-hydrolysing)